MDIDGKIENDTGMKLVEIARSNISTDTGKIEGLEDILKKIVESQEKANENDWDVQLAEVLWNADFKDVNESTDKRFTCFMFHSSREIYRNNPESFARFVSFTNWFLEKGADPYRKRMGSPALHYIAEEFGFHLIVPSSVNLNPDPVESLKLMRLLQEDSHQDSCVCACSRHGCCAVTRFVQGSSMLEMRQSLGTDQILPDWYKYPTLGIDAMFDANPDALFRALTFEALEIRHTCEQYYTPKEPDEHEWEERIQLLEKLTDEFVFAYEQSNLSIFDILEKEWKIRMEKIIFTSRSSRQKEASQLCEIGVVLEDEGESEEENYAYTVYRRAGFGGDRQGISREDSTTFAQVTPDEMCTYES
ncbi:hypothetical protein N7488_006736 [Penicillium malachiteum]|nr:hypothetical protein N7488_006736 [Penicillium malachiteum]